MGKLVFSTPSDAKVEIDITMKGLTFSCDSSEDITRIEEADTVEIYPLDTTDDMYSVVNNPVIKLLKEEDNRKYFRIFSKYVQEESEEMKLLNRVMKVTKISAQSFTDEQALQVKDIYDEFEIGRKYLQGEFFTYNGELFKVNQAHTSQSQWIPGSVGTESLYTKVVLTEEGYPIWKQPTGAHDAYNKGDIVEYNGELYKSLIDGNAYSPDAYPAGWEKYTEPEA